MVLLDTCGDSLKEFRFGFDEQYDFVIVTNFVLPEVDAFDGEALDAGGQTFGYQGICEFLRRCSVRAGGQDECVGHATLSFLLIVTQGKNAYFFYVPPPSAGEHD